MVVTRGAILPLAAVYTISFLTVMAFFAIGNILLKIRRSRLPRPETAPIAFVVLALFGVIIALYGNIKANPAYLVTFLQYFIPAMLLISAMLVRNDIMTVMVKTMESITKNFRKLAIITQKSLHRSMHSLRDQEFVFFSKGDDIATLNKVMIYISQNEVTNKVKIVTILKNHQQPPEQFLSDFATLDRAYPDMDMEYIILEGCFNPEMVEKLSNKWNIPKNFMFISSPGEKFSYRVEELGGVRLIL
ncbi:hypothetical protein [Halpernia sp. GG3]